MNRSRVVRFAIMIVLTGFGALLYAELQSIHQIFRISDPMIANAPSEKARNELLSDKARRDTEERRHKLLVGLGLSLDLTLLMLVSLSFLRKPISEKRSLF